MKLLSTLGLLLMPLGVLAQVAAGPLPPCDKNHFILDYPCALEGPPQGAVAFVSERDGNPEIYVANLDGSGLVRLTDHPGRDLDPAWSPDGKRIAFVSDRAGSTDIYVMNADGSGVVRRTSGRFNLSPAWSPDGKWITFTSLRDDEWGLDMMAADAGAADAGPVRMAVGWNADAAWSPDGQRIAFVSDRRAYDFVYDVYVMRADGSGATPILMGGSIFGPPWTFFFQPAWSPDGGKIAAVRCAYAWENCYPSSAIVVANADGSGSRTLVQAGGYARPTWSPDGRILAYSVRTCSRCKGELRFVSLDGTRSGVIAADGYSPAWRPIVREATPVAVR